ncbi:MAG: glycosyltransferase, partial [Pirellulales bacterium]
RIAFCVTSLGIGGAERCLSHLATRLPREEFACEVHVLQARPVPDACALVDAMEAADVPLYFYDATRVSDGPGLIRRLGDAWRRSRPQLVQSMMFHANVAAALAARRAGVELHVTGIRAAERTANWRAKVERIFVRSAARHVCVSAAVADYARSVGRLPESSLVVIPNGVDVATFRDALPVGNPSFRPITFVGRIAAQKNVVELIHHASRFLDALPQHGLWIVGDGPLLGEAQAAAGRLGNRIEFLGLRDDIPAILKTSELLVLPSHWEGMPNVVLEAMAAGLPVVATDAEGIRELLGPRGTEQIVPVGDMQALAQRIVSIVRQPALAAELGAANAARAAAEFSVEMMLERYIRLYDELLPISSS